MKPTTTRYERPIANAVACLLVLCGLVCVLALSATDANATTYHYASNTKLVYGQEWEGNDRHSYTQNYGHVIAASVPSGEGWVGVRAHNTSHQSYGLNAQNWVESIHSYSGANLLYMIVGNIYDDGVGNGYTTWVNAHGTY